jgi:hypothetical protein
VQSGAGRANWSAGVHGRRKITRNATVAGKAGRQKESELPMKITLTDDEIRLLAELLEGERKYLGTKAVLN